MIDRWPHPACLDEVELLKSCTIGRGRSSGPGGQHRNKVETEVIITHDPTGIRTHAGERRSQIENKHVAVFRMRLALAINHRVGVPAGEIGSTLWRSRVRAGKIACSTEHRDFPAMLAEALDVIAAADWDAKKASLRLGCSATQLIRFVKDHPAAMERWNRERTGRKLHPLK